MNDAISSTSFERRIFTSEKIQRAAIPDAPKIIVETLKKHGFRAYLVGGCVRDLLLDRVPKDFDMVTDALPEKVQEIFPRSRIIGRRFKLVHVYNRFKYGVTEVATFRRALDEDSKKSYDRQLSEDGLLIHDNEYGTMEEDSFRRDFTLNALYFDIDTDEIIDFVGGWEDIQTRTLRAIGDPNSRLIEDPARMIRAVRFIASLQLNPDQKLLEAIAKNRSDLSVVKPARLFEEFQKLFLSGDALQIYHTMREQELMPEMLVQSDASIRLTRFAMANTDRRVKQDRPVIAAFLVAAMLWHEYKRECNYVSNEDSGNNETRFLAASKVIGRLNQRVHIPRRTVFFVRDIFELQHPLETKDPKRIKQLLGLKRFRAAFDLLELRAKTGEIAKETAEWWERIQSLDEVELDHAIKDLSPRKKRRRRRRRRPRKNNRSTQAANQP